MERQGNHPYYYNQQQPPNNLPENHLPPQQQNDLQPQQQLHLPPFPEQLHLPSFLEQEQEQPQQQQQVQEGYDFVENILLQGGLNDVPINVVGGDIIPLWPVGIQDNNGGFGVDGGTFPQLTTNQDNNGGGGVAGDIAPQWRPIQDTGGTFPQLTTNQDNIGGGGVAGDIAPQWRPIQDTGGTFPQLTTNQDNIGGGGVAGSSRVGGGGGVGVARDGGVPQWTEYEISVLMLIRAELDQTFTKTKRRRKEQNNKDLWEVISNTMKEKGYNRSSEACKRKWGAVFKDMNSCSQTMEADKLKEKFPFYDNLEASRKDKGLLPGEEGGRASGTVMMRSMRCWSEDEDDNEESGEGRSKRKRASSSSSNLQEVLEELVKQQGRFIEQQMQWRKAWEDREAKEEERRIKETEWRERMEALERERLMMDRSWREREEERRRRETEWRQKMEEMELDRLIKDKVIEEEKSAKRDEYIKALQQKLQREKDI